MRTSSAKPNFLPFLSTPSARRATSVLLFGVQQVLISIHALREEGDHPYSSWERGSNEFLSTPSARRATIPRPHLLCWHHDFIHALREEGDDVLPVWCRLWGLFYPRPPRGGRRSAAGLEGQAGRFLSTPSARRATLYNHRHAHCCQISIHALREEGDECREHAGRNQCILSTPSARRATSDSPASWQSCCISIHALREEGDLLEVSQWAM